MTTKRKKSAKAPVRKGSSAAPSKRAKSTRRK